MLKVTITDRQRLPSSARVRIPRLLVRRLVRAAAPQEWDRAEVSVVFVDDAEMCDLNRRFTGREGPTDVLAFPLEEEPPPAAAAQPGKSADFRAPPAPRIMGEVVVSVEHAVGEAARRGIGARDELALYVVHGVLHLAGFDDNNPRNRGKMYRKEADVLLDAGLPSVRSSPRRR